MEIKTCTKCGTDYPSTAEYFHRQVNGKGGLRAACKVCCCKEARQYSSVYYHQHRRERLECGKQYRQTLMGHLRRVYNRSKDRCNNPTRKDYKWYGGRGIENKFVNFNHFMQHVTIDLCITDIKQIKDLQIDRIDNNGHYEPRNIRFVTCKVNNNNRRNSKNARNK